MLDELTQATQIVSSSFDFSSWDTCACAALHAAVDASGSISDPSDERYIALLKSVVDHNEFECEDASPVRLAGAVHDGIQGIANAAGVSPQDATILAFAVARLRGQHLVTSP